VCISFQCYLLSFPFVHLLIWILFTHEFPIKLNIKHTYAFVFDVHVFKNTLYENVVKYLTDAVGHWIGCSNAKQAIQISGLCCCCVSERFGTFISAPSGTDLRHQSDLRSQACF